MSFRSLLFTGTILFTSYTYPTILNPFTWFVDADTVITDVSQTSVIPVQKILKPTSICSLKSILSASKSPISIAGGRFSQGGQIACAHGIVIDMTGINRVVHLDPAAQEITVEAGITWKKIQEYIDPFELSIKVMQSYNDFTVGGSLSVNVHGRDIHYGPLIETVQSIEILLADGSIVTASRTQNPELFAGAIGGYGALGIITKATLSLRKNSKIERQLVPMPIEKYPQFFKEHVKNNPKAVFHNADLYPTDFKKVSSITWYETEKELTDPQPLHREKKVYPKHLIGEQALRRLPKLHTYRPALDSKTKPADVVWRNNEMSSTVKTLEPLLRFPTTTVLQEYFVPVDNLIPFINGMRTVAELYGVNIINISIRYIPQNTESVLSYAKKESFSLVFYINILNTEGGLEYAQKWTQKLIDLALFYEGTYYLPYQLFGSESQFNRAYPNLETFKELKKRYDPQNRFSNCLLTKYGI